MARLTSYHISSSGSLSNTPDWSQGPQSCDPRLLIRSWMCLLDSEYETLSIDYRVVNSLFRSVDVFGDFVRMEIRPAGFCLVPLPLLTNTLHYLGSQRWNILRATGARHPRLFVRCYDGEPIESIDERIKCKGNCRQPNFFVERTPTLLHPLPASGFCGSSIDRALAKLCQYINTEHMSDYYGYDLFDIAAEGPKNTWIAFANKRRLLIPQPLKIEIKRAMEIRQACVSDRLFDERQRF